ncbi:MAG: ABC transporter ATP-binding protein [Pseudomonadota bacterium]
MLALSHVTLLRDSAQPFSQTFAAGEITVVLGANRSGKTNLCRLIAGLDSDAHGGVSVDGTDIGGLSPQQRSVSLVYQAFVNYPNLTVEQNIDSPMRAQGVPSSARRERVRELAKLLQISDLLPRLPSQLSGGQQQRVAIARALAKGAQVLLLDEPLVNLDFKLRETLEAELGGLLRETGTIVIWTSSDPRDAFALGDRVLLLSQGKKVQDGTPIDVYRTPASLDAMALLAEPDVNRFSRNGRECALRPEHVTIDEQKADDEDLRFSMAVTACETNGDESFIHGRVESQDWVVRCRGIQTPAAGATLSLHARSDDVRRF